MDTDKICQALYLSDARKCENEATHADGIFCWFHSKQAQGLYEGYKRRNKRLDELDDEAPAYLKTTKTALANETFEDVKEHSSLVEVQSHLFRKYVYIGRVIEARKLHHKHFYPLQVDYGHQAYLDKLSSQRNIVLGALGAICKRISEVLYHDEQWYEWVRNAQEDEEANRDKEQKRIKQEAALFRRHMKSLETKMEQARQKEEKKRQDAFLEEAYQQRMAESEDDAMWDPVEDIEFDRRDLYIDLIKHFLWMEVEAFDKNDNTSTASDTNANNNNPKTPSEATPGSKKKKKKPKAKSATEGLGSSHITGAGSGSRGQLRLLNMVDRDIYPPPEPSDQEPSKYKIESEKEMRERLSKGVEKNLEDIEGWQLVGTLDNPIETFNKTAPMPDDEIETIINDVREIKLLLFSRLLLAQTSLLPAAIEASSVDDFLANPAVTTSDLRDLCLKVEEPTLQLIRDACADFARAQGADEPEEAGSETYESEDEDTYEDMIGDHKKYEHLHSDDWFMNKMHDMTLRDLGMKKKKKSKKSKRRSKVTLCGKPIWNHASEKSMSRDGWLHFSIMAKDCDLKDAIQLCRSWTEFSDLSCLTYWQFFPASNWVSWGNNRFLQQLQNLGFYPYFVDFDAVELSRSQQVGGRSRGRRQHDVVETRNIMCGHMKRNDPVTRRFIQYLVMHAGELLVLARDGKTGRVVTAPTEEHLWTYRKKQGLGRASKHEWENVLEVGPEYYDMTDSLRDWRFGFDDYYDVFIWDFVPGREHMQLYNLVITELRNAWRITHPRDVWKHQEPILRTLTRDEVTLRTRLLKPGEDALSLYDVCMDDRNQYFLWEIKGETQVRKSEKEATAKSRYMFYNEANVVEDKVLFPEEADPHKKNQPFREIRNRIDSAGAVMGSSSYQMAEGLRAIDRNEDPWEAQDKTMDTAEGSLWALPKIWTTGIKEARRGPLPVERRKLLRKTGLHVDRKSLPLSVRIGTSDPMEVMERDRAVGFKEGFHAGDLEPVAQEKYAEIQDKIETMLSFSHSGSTDWVWFLADIMAWLKVRGDYEDYANDGALPWPHAFIIQDMLRAYAAMAMFFPELEVNTLVTKYISSSYCEDFRNSLLFKPKERSQERPDRRTGTSYMFRDSKFWDPWNKFYKEDRTDRYYADVYPWDWSLAIRPIIAKLYRAGVLAPAHYENHPYCVPGYATAAEETHRPSDLDLFICYSDEYKVANTVIPPSFPHPSKWPEVVPTAEAFSKSRPDARFAVLRVWSSPHFYPYMLGLHRRQECAFLDSAGRTWEWKFVPKDMPGSEYSAHNTISSRLQILKGQFGDRVISRGDLILVMGEDAADLFRTSMAVTFAIQTKPWLREIDLWKSFINVDLEFVQQLDSFWLD